MARLINITKAELPSRKLKRVTDLPDFAVDDTFWGYIITSNQKLPIHVIMAQGLAWFLGLSFVFATVGIWFLPATMFDGDALAMRFSASCGLGGLALLFLWYSARGVVTEIHVDRHRGEVREVLRTRSGRSSLVGRYQFDTIGGVFLERSKQHRNQARLVMRYRNTAQTMPVATGHVALLEELRDRLGAELMTVAAPRPARGPQVLAPMERLSA